MGVIAAFFARVFRLSLGRPCTGFFLIRQEVRAICKTRNQLSKTCKLHSIFALRRDQASASLPFPLAHVLFYARTET